MGIEKPNSPYNNRQQRRVQGSPGTGRDGTGPSPCPPPCPALSTQGAERNRKRRDNAERSAGPRGHGTARLGGRRADTQPCKPAHLPARFPPRQPPGAAFFPAGPADSQEPARGQPPARALRRPAEVREKEEEEEGGAGAALAAPPPPPPGGAPAAPTFPAPHVAPAALPGTCRAAPRRRRRPAAPGGAEGRHGRRGRRHRADRGEQVRSAAPRSRSQSRRRLRLLRLGWAGGARPGGAGR